MGLSSGLVESLFNQVGLSSGFVRSLWCPDSSGVVYLSILGSSGVISGL